MARQIIQLTNTKILNAKPKDKDYTLSDGQGLYLLVKSNGSKLWRFNYYDLLKKRKLISLGSYPETSLLDARTKRDEYRALLAKDIEPQDYIFKQKEQAIFNQCNTLIGVAKDWREMKSSKVEADTMKDQWRLLELHLFPHLGNMPISDITAPFTRMKLQKLADDKKFEMLKKVIRGLNEIMRFAVNAGLIQFNPTANLQELFPSGEVQHRPSIHPDKLPQFLEAVNKANIQLQTRCLLEWQLLTMVRPSEAAGTMWREIDFENKTWLIPKDRMKGKKRSHLVPLSRQAINILNIMRPITGNCDFVFPKNGDLTTNMSSETINKALRKMGYQGILCAHGFRSIASTALNENEFNVEIIEALLSHVKGDKVRTAYDRSTYEKQKRQYIEWWGNFVEKSSVRPCLLGAGGLDLLNP
ncbi:tyrosine-type recombinase/integrase [Histophilus somni]|uniref:tyrosine-type recombinase/integrase n=1 Tax=Histophilus somni TaxID=731 RepID=UPI00109C9ECA|nr:tyrosine-type recombinase/integrase [Histophilus somni]QEH25679.1 tyrosine-type recombinase/integrase [Histophilus somni]THA89643.1 DUF4102 domain-containing protein [Histophilus somni]